MEENLVSKIMRAVLKSEGSQLVATDVATTVAHFAKADDKWLKHVAHWADARTVQSIRAKARGSVTFSRSLGVKTNKKDTEESAEEHTGQGAGGRSEWKEVGKKKKAQEEDTAPPFL